MRVSPPHGIEDSNQARIRPRESVMSTIRRPNDPSTTDSHPNVVPLSQLIPDERTTTGNGELQHVDYDRHPLRVQGLDHYIDHPQSAERFHIW
jgi:hypothetical protein